MNMVPELAYLLSEHLVNNPGNLGAGVWEFDSKIICK